MFNRHVFISIVAVFAFIFIFDWVFHTLLLESSYQATATLWRSKGEMTAHFPWLVAGQFGMAVFITLLYYGFVRDRRLGSGLSFGLVVGLFMASPFLINYAVTPYPLSLVISWMGGSVVEFFLVGGLLAATCRGTQPLDTSR